MKLSIAFSLEVLSLGFLLGGPAIAGLMDSRFLYMRNQFFAFDATEEKEFKRNTQAATFDQRLNPDSPEDLRTFKQRYFTNNYYADSVNAPVIYVLCGEASCDGGSFWGPAVENARKFKARLVSLEHRYYGKSQPFTEMTGENLRYLTTRNALGDLARFQDFISNQNGWKGPWIAMGGSYSGSLAAYYRLTYPEKVKGALASSAPVEAKARFEEYDQGVTLAAGPECARAIRDVVAQVQATFDQPEKLAEMKRLFGSEEIRDPIDFIYTLADMASTAVQYGTKDQFCQSILGSNPVQAYAKTGREIFKWFGITPLEDSFQGAESTESSKYSQGVGMRQWLWQSCTEYGYFQVAHSDPDLSTRSPFLTLDYHEKMCKRLFGLKEPLNTENINQVYYKPFLVSTRVGASQIFFTNGSIDPWRFLSITRERGNDISPLMSYLTIDGAAHCNDLSSSAQPNVQAAQAEFTRLIEKWLQ